MYDGAVQKVQPKLISFQLLLCNLPSITRDKLTVKKRSPLSVQNSRLVGLSQRKRHLYRCLFL